MTDEELTHVRPPRVLALIPARGGSKAILGKNLCRVGGLPLVARSIRDALAVEAIDTVYVTTDDQEVARVAELEGAGVIARPSELAHDTASTESAIAHALAHLAQAGEPEPDIVVLLQCTSPFRRVGQLEAALEQMIVGAADSIVSVVRRHTFHWQLEADGSARAMNYEPAARPRRQEHEGTLEETGSFYVFRREMFARSGARLGGRIEAFEVPAEDALEIDEGHELASARASWHIRGEQPSCLRGGSPWLVIDLDALGRDEESGSCFDESDILALEAWRVEGGRVAMFSDRSRLSHETGGDRFTPERWAVGCDSAADALTALALDRSIVAANQGRPGRRAPVFALSKGAHAQELRTLVDHLSVVDGDPLATDLWVASNGRGAALDEWIAAMCERVGRANAQSAPQRPGGPTVRAA